MPTRPKPYIEDWRNQWGFPEACGRPSPKPGVVSWARANHQGKPYFIKVIPKSSSNENARGTSIMFVPGAFVKEHYRELQRDVTLVNKDGRTWRVTFQSPVAYPVWSKGWRRFVRDINLETGDHIVFILERDSFFHFTHFDKEGIIIGRQVNTPPNNNPDAAAADSDQFQTSSLGKRRNLITDNYPDRHTLRKEPASVEIDNNESSDEHEGDDVSHSQEISTAGFSHSDSPSMQATCSTYVKVTHQDDHEAGMPQQAPKQVLKAQTTASTTDSCQPGRIPVKLNQVKREVLIAAEDDPDSMPPAQRLSARNPYPYSHKSYLEMVQKFQEQRRNWKKNVRA